MGLLRTLIGSSSSSKQTPPPPSSPFENDTDDLPTNESSTSTSASNPLPLLRSNDTGSSLIDPETGLEMDTPYSQSQSPSLDRVRTIRQADYLPSPKNSLEVEDSAERSRGPEKVLGSPMDQGKAEGNDGTGVGGNRTPSGNAATGGSRFGIGTITKRGRKRSSDLSSSPSSNETTTSDRTHPENQIDPLQRSSLPPLQSSSSPPTTLPQTQSNPLPPPITTSTLSPLDYSSSSTSPSGRSTEQARILSDKRSRRSSQEEDPRRAVSKTNEGEAGVGSSSSGSGIGDEARTHHVRGEGSNGGERGMTRNHDDDGGYGYRSGLVQGQGEDYRIGNGNGVGLNIRGMGMRSAMEGGGGLRVRAGSGNRNGCGDEDDEGHGKDLPHRDYGKNVSAKSMTWDDLGDYSGLNQRMISQTSQLFFDRFLRLTSNREEARSKGTGYLDCPLPLQWEVALLPFPTERPPSKISRNRDLSRKDPSPPNPHHLNIQGENPQIYRRYPLIRRMLMSGKVLDQ